MSNQYTPGPWRAFDNDRQGWDILPASGLAPLIAKVPIRQKRWEADKANARLIEQAPTMLELLDATTDAIHWTNISECAADISSESCTCGFHEWIEAVKQARQRVRGESVT